GSTIGGLMDSFGTAISIALQYGVPLDELVKKFSHTRFEPMGYTTNENIRIAKSLVDYIARWLEQTFSPVMAGESPVVSLEYEASSTATVEAEKHPASREEQFASFQGDAPSCDNCGSLTVRNGNCYLCHNCGNSLGCS